MSKLHEEFSQRITQYVIRGKVFNRIRVGKDKFLTKCDECRQKHGRYHLLSCPLETSPCGFCKVEFSVECLCPYHEEE